MSDVLKSGRKVARLEPAVFEVAALTFVNLESEFFAFVKVLFFVCKAFLLLEKSLLGYRR